jgi:hypothetical protein
MAATRRKPLANETDQPPAFEPAAVIDLDELREAERDPYFKELLKEADEEGERAKRVKRERREEREVRERHGNGRPRAA